MQYTFKPRGNYHLFWLIFSLLTITLPLGIAFTAGIFSQEAKVFCIAALAVNISLPFILFGIARWFYPYRYEIGNGKIIKYKRNTVVFQLDISALNQLKIKRGNKKCLLRFLLNGTFDAFQNCPFTVISFISKNDYFNTESHPTKLLDIRLSEKMLFEMVPYSVALAIQKVLSKEG